jgi:hypothetical protein
MSPLKSSNAVSAYFEGEVGQEVARLEAAPIGTRNDEIRRIDVFTTLRGGCWPRPADWSAAI